MHKSFNDKLCKKNQIKKQAISQVQVENAVVVVSAKSAARSQFPAKITDKQTLQIKKRSLFVCDLEVNLR